MVTLRIRSLMWFGIGIALTIVLVWSFAAWRADAAVGPNESTVVPVTPVRVLDTRDPTNVGLPGPFVSAVSQDLTITGTIPTTTGDQAVVPVGATGVALNVTVVNSTANGFLSIRPADARGAPTTSSLNFLAGQIVANAVEVNLPTAGADAGKMEITFDAYGIAGPTTDVIIDVVGYKTNAGLQSIVADLAAKANAANVYSRAEAAGIFIAHGDVIMSHATSQLTASAGAPPSSLEAWTTGNLVSGDGSVHLSLVGPSSIGGVDYGLKSVEYCVTGKIGGARVDHVSVYGFVPYTARQDLTDRSVPGCYTVTVNRAESNAYDLVFGLAGGGSLRITGVRSTWAVASTLAPTAVTEPDPVSPDPLTGR
jgi:hypothetical protein